MHAFHKMHGLGNFFIFFDEIGQDFSRLKKAGILKSLCDCRRGVGGDGVIFMMEPRDPKHHCRMQMFNSDGTEAEMCGNAIRGVAHLYKSHNLGHEPILIETGGGVREVRFEGARDGICSYRVEMGPASFNLIVTGELLPKKEQKPLQWQDDLLEPVYVNVGNPHAVLFLQTPLGDDSMVSLGAWMETNPNHPRRINVEFVEIINKSEVRVHVWERGCGMTQACGTGATAVAAAGIKLGKLVSPVTVHMPGGDLFITADSKGTLFMAGPIEHIAVGNLMPSFIRRLYAEYK